MFPARRVPRQLPRTQPAVPEALRHDREHRAGDRVGEVGRGTAGAASPVWQRPLRVLPGAAKLEGLRSGRRWQGRASSPRAVGHVPVPAQ